MTGLILNNTLRFLFLVALQGLILNNVLFSGYINPYVYVLFILMLPFEIPVWLLLLLGFITGLSVDFFTGTIGMHTSAAVFMAYCRIFVLKLLVPREGYDSTNKPSIADMGFLWFLFYSGLLVLLHHLWLFQVEAFRFSALPQSLLKTLLSSIFTIALIFLIQLLLYRRGKQTRA